MSDISGDFNYWFSRVEPKWENREQTGISQMVIGLSCSFTGQDEEGNQVNESVYIDGTTGFNPPLSFENLTGSVEEISNEYASSNNWFQSLEDRIENKIMKQSVPVKNFPFVSVENDEQESRLPEEKKAFSPRTKKKSKKLERKKNKIKDDLQGKKKDERKDKKEINE